MEEEIKRVYIMYVNIITRALQSVRFATVQMFTIKWRDRGNISSDVSSDFSYSIQPPHHFGT